MVYFPKTTSALAKAAKAGTMNEAVVAAAPGFSASVGQLQKASELLAGPLYSSVSE